MAQLQKYNHKQTRNIEPCIICGHEHPTWQHGKDEGQVYQELRSRQRNPRDPLFVSRTTKPLPTEQVNFSNPQPIRNPAMASVGGNSSS